MTCIRKTTVFCVLLLALCNVPTYVETYNKCYSNYNFYCRYRQFCCKRRNPENNVYYVCRENCIGESCDHNNDCATGETCCDSDGKCIRKSGDCDVNHAIKGLAGWIVAIIVISIIVGVVIPVAVLIYRCCCAARAARGGVTVAQVQPVTTGTIFLANQQHQPHPNQQGQAMYVQNFQPDPNQPGTAYPVGASVSPIATTPQTDVKQY